MTLDKTFMATIVKDTVTTGWTVVVWPESVAFLGTRNTVKVTGTIDGHEFQATFMPSGDGTHMLPLRAALRKTLKKDVGDTVEVHLTGRQ